MSTGKGPLRIAIEDFLNGFGFGDKIKEWLNKLFNDTVTTLKDGTVIPKHEKVNGLLDAYIQVFNSLELGKIPPLGQFIIGFGIALSVLTTLGNSISAPFGQLLTYVVSRIAKQERFTKEELALIRTKSPENYAVYKDDALDAGGTNERLEITYELSRQYMTAFEYVILWRRGTLSETELQDKLNRLGIREDDITNLKKVTEVIPTVTDLIYLQVKEAFDDQASTRFQHDEGEKTQVIEWAAKQGLSEEWVNRYWRAHWNLPSPQQVFEMLQRLRPGLTDNPVTLDDVKTFLKMADYSPFWRERLTEIAYSPFTRVDVRRMYKTGTLNVQQVKEAYLDLGYNDEKAQALTEFTIAYEAEEETGVVRSSVTAAYDSGMIDRAQAEDMLSKGGYDAVTIAFYLDAIDFNHSLEVKKIKLDNIHKRYVNGLIDETTVNGEINMLALPAERVTAILELWGTERENQTTLLTITQMEVLLERKIVTEADYTRIAKQRGYTDESIKWTLQRIAGEAADTAQKDAEKAQADSERLNKSNSASQYQKDKSAIDALIAQARAQITDIDVALHGDLSADEVASLSAQKDLLKQYISQQNVFKAQLKFNATPGTTTIEV